MARFRRRRYRPAPIRSNPDPLTVTQVPYTPPPALTTPEQDLGPEVTNPDGNTWPGRNVLFTSWGRYLDAVTPRPDGTAVAAYNTFPLRDSIYGRDPDWIGVRGYGTAPKSFEDVLGLARDGWIEGLAAARKISDVLVDRVATMIVRDDYYHADEGSVLDLGRYLDREPECWITEEQVHVEGSGRLIRLVFHGFISAGVTPEQVLAKGACVAAAVELLEMAGNRVQVEYAGGAKGRNGERAMVRVIVKAFEETLDLARLVFVMAHPAATRVLLFGAWEHFASEVRQSVGAEGSFYSQPNDIPAGPDRGDIYIPSGALRTIGHLDPAACQAWVLDILREQGVTIRE